ncbi:MAG TPA: DUF6531 domain-containing protein [Acidimicrobiales bacterium]|nr:DUF6531 domain-containing protein [Acidimicrobiales bacterium]
MLFGGWSDATGGYVNDTWTFDGTNWARLSPATSPSARGYARAAFDARNTKLVLFGGFNGSVDVSDTWTFDGSTWALQAPATVPAARNQYAMAYNPTLGSVMLYGGTSGSVFLDDTWLWNGSNWQPSSTILHPPARRGAAFAVSPASGQLVLIGGDAPGVIYSATQLFEYPLLGEQGYYTLDTKPLNDRMHLHVNVATGNLVVDANDASIRGTGLSLNVGRSYNGLSASAFDVGNSWNLGLGSDVYWSALPNGSVVILGLFGGRPVHFAKNATGYTTPPGVNADLVHDSAAGTLTLTFRQSQERYVFEYPGGRLLRHVDRNNNTISFAYATGTQLSSITDTQGRSVAFTYNTAGNIASFKDAAGRTVSYGYDANNNLTALTDAAGKVTNFGYDATLALTKITDPAGRITTIGYDSYLRVTSLTQVTDTTAMTGPTTKYAYNPGQTVITDPNGRATTYTENLTGHVAKVVDPLGRQRARTYTPNSDVATYNGNTTSAVYNLTYDTNNNLTQLQSPATASAQTRASTYFSYATPSTSTGSKYLASSRTDAQGNCRAFTYDAAGNHTATHDGLKPNTEAAWIFWRLLRLDFQERMEPCRTATGSRTPPSAGTRRSSVSGRPGWCSRRSPRRASATA